MIESEISLKPIKQEDEEFLYQVYASSRQEEMALVGWGSEQINSFLKMQFNAQHKYYMENYTDSSFDIIWKDDAPVGRIYVARREKEIRIIDITLLPQYRRKNIGSAILKDILAEAAKDNKSVSIHVERNNPAINLYQRLGFQKIADKGIYFLMEWKAE